MGVRRVVGEGWRVGGEGGEGWRVGVQDWGEHGVHEGGGGLGVREVWRGSCGEGRGLEGGEGWRVEGEGGVGGKEGCGGGVEGWGLEVREVRGGGLGYRIGGEHGCMREVEGWG